jgi:molecular chaperone GrpE
MTNDERYPERTRLNEDHSLLGHIRRHLSASHKAPGLDGRLDAIEGQLQAVGESLRRIELRDGADEPAGPGELAALRETVAALEKQIGRAGREQFKANTLAETQTAQLAAALDALRAADARRETELAALRERELALQAEARLDVVRSILPALDGLDEALRSGQQVLEQSPAPRTRPAADSQPHASGGWLRALLAPPPQPEAEPQQAEPLRESLESWLVGLTFVRRRLLEALAAAGVVPIEAAGQPFDPRYHVAVEIVPAIDGVAPDTVTQELRRGYLAGERVLRHAEVAVTRAE